MRNSTVSGNTLIQAAVEELRDRLPPDWGTTLTIVPRRSRPLGYEPDALLTVTAPDGSKNTVVIEAKSTITAQQAAQLGPRLVADAGHLGAGGVLAVAPFLSQMARQRLREAGVSYYDRTGNMWVTLGSPALFIESQGATKDPAPTDRGVRSLKGAKSARLVRALCDWRPPIGVRELARRAGTDPGYATRVLGLLEQEDLVQRAQGEVREVNWQSLLRRWTQNYDVTTTNVAFPYLSPRGVDTFLRRLSSSPLQYGLTGSFAVPNAAAVARGSFVTCYVEEPERSAEELGLRPADSGSNVLLLQPFDPVVYARSRKEEGLTRVALSQCAADLLTGAGREPAEAESLLTWMESNQDAWRS